MAETKEFLYAQNTYSEERPKPGAIVFTPDLKIVSGVVRLHIEGDNWRTELQFQGGEGSMWIYPPKVEPCP